MTTQNLTASTLLNGTLTSLLAPGYTSFRDLITGDGVAAANFVDLSAISNVFGSASAAYDPSTPGNIYLTDGHGNTIREAYNQNTISDPTYGSLAGYSKTFDISIGSQISFHGWATSNSNNFNNPSVLIYTEGFDYLDKKGTSSTIDDVRANYSDTTVLEWLPGSASTEYATRSTQNISQSYSNINYSLSESSSSVSAYSYANGNMTGMSADFARTYSFSSTGDKFSVSYDNNIHVNNGFVNGTFSSVEWSTKDYSATVEGSFSYSGSFSVPNTGSLQSDNLSSVYSDFQQSFLPNFLAQDNVFEVTNNSGVSITTGGGNDQLFGGQGYDTAVFDFSSNDITSIALGNNGLDLVIKTGMEEKYLHGFEQLNFTDRSLGVQEFMSSDAARSLIEGPNNLASADLSSWVNSSSYAQNSGLTNQLAAPSA